MPLLIDTPITLEVSGKPVTMTPREAAEKLSHPSSVENIALSDQWDTSQASIEDYFEEKFDDAIAVIREYYRLRDLARWRDISVEAPDEGQRVHILCGDGLRAKGAAKFTDRRWEIVTDDGMSFSIWLWRPVQEKK